jgi:hypothetical protein
MFAGWPKEKGTVEVGAYMEAETERDAGCIEFGMLLILLAGAGAAASGLYCIHSLHDARSSVGAASVMSSAAVDSQGPWCWAEKGKSAAMGGTSIGLCVGAASGEGGASRGSFGASLKSSKMQYGPTWTPAEGRGQHMAGAGWGEWTDGRMDEGRVKGR